MTSRLIGYLNTAELYRLASKPRLIKIESYSYSFTSESEYHKTKKYWKKKFIKDFLPMIDKNALTHIFKTYELPSIDDKRVVNVSPFQNVPVIDIVIFISAITLLLKRKT